MNSGVALVVGAGQDHVARPCSPVTNRWPYGLTIRRCCRATPWNTSLGVAGGVVEDDHLDHAAVGEFLVLTSRKITPAADSRSRTSCSAAALAHSQPALPRWSRSDGVITRRAGKSSIRR